MAQLFALVEFGCIVGGVVGFSKDAKSSNFGRVGRLLVTLAAGGVGLWWLMILSGLAGMTL